MGSGAKFRVVVPGLRSTVHDWRRAMDAPASELPDLNPAQKDFAKRFGISEEEYRRSYLAGLYGERRMQQTAEKLGQIVAEILSGLGTNLELLAVKNDFDMDLWIFRVRKIGDTVVDIPVSDELGADLLDSGLPEYRNDLRRLIEKALRIQ